MTNHSGQQEVVAHGKRDWACVCVWGGGGGGEGGGVKITFEKGYGQAA